MIPLKTSIHFDRKSAQSLHIQLSNQIIQLIKNQTLSPGAKLPGSRTLAEQLNVHRKTIVACYDELMLQGWIESIPKKGTFVHQNLPLFNLQKLSESSVVGCKKMAGFTYYKNQILSKKPSRRDESFMYLNDGISDGRITPMDEIARTYRRIAGKKNIVQHLSYGSTFGNETLREVLVKYLNDSRGLRVTKENVLITRGSQMGIWLSAQLLLQQDDIIVVGATNYKAADITFLNQKAQLCRVPVDEFGIVTDEIEKLCQKRKIKAVYVTSHHHHPTTVTLSAERRIHLLNLARVYSFAIIEDDYDYDFNYDHAPILPLASHDKNGNVIYIGSICKTVAPVFRIGYLIASKEFVDESAKLRGYVDRQGDALLELTFADFIKSGDLDRHIRKVMKIYKQRCDLFCQLLTDELKGFLEFDAPKGGMAVWTKLNPKYSWEDISIISRKHRLEIGDWQRYDNTEQGHNYIRIGFAAHNEDEIREMVRRMKMTFEEVRKLELAEVTPKT